MHYLVFYLLLFKGYSISIECTPYSPHTDYFICCMSTAITTIISSSAGLLPPAQQLVALSPVQSVLLRQDDYS